MDSNFISYLNYHLSLEYISCSFKISLYDSILTYSYPRRLKIMITYIKNKLYSQLLYIESNKQLYIFNYSSEKKFILKSIFCIR